MCAMIHVVENDIIHSFKLTTHSIGVLHAYEADNLSRSSLTQTNQISVNFMWMNGEEYNYRVERAYALK